MSVEVPIERDYLELVGCIRALLGKRPLPREPEGSFQFTLDGRRRMDRHHWAVELGISRQAVDLRFATLNRRLKSGMAPDQAYALATAPALVLMKRKRGRRSRRKAAA